MPQKTPHSNFNGSVLIKLNQVDTRIDAIDARNKNVEVNKAWQASRVRIISITILTYVIVSLTMEFLHFDQPFTAAVIPTIGYFLSTLLLGVIRRQFTAKLDNNE